MSASEPSMKHREQATHYQNLHLLGWSYKYSGNLIIGCMVVVVEEA
jgi:hypothetical protein